MSSLDEAQIRSMVEAFYERVRRDPELGPIFAARLDGQWPAHLDKMVSFWSSALLRTGRYAGNPRRTHAAIEGLGPQHFERWLGYFEATVQALFDPPVAEDLVRRAHAMARGLMAALPPSNRGLPLTEAPESESAGSQRPPMS